MSILRKLLVLQLTSYVTLLVAMALGTGSTQDQSIPDRLSAVFSSPIFWWGLYLLVYMSVTNPLVLGLLVWFVVAVLVPEKPVTAARGSKNWFAKFGKSPALPLALQGVGVLISWIIEPQKRSLPAAGVGLLILLFMSLSYLTFRLLERVSLVRKSK
ncbi:unannotated protein [freshwater metagenome]|uniref:Unannotated protein n=1 Tax=freshwater metagenome TaxID=449393 RepID=A0A6J7JP72_9ZZZZ